MVYETIFLVAGIVLLLIFSRHFFEKVSKMLAYAGLALIAITGLAAFLIFQDISDLRENFDGSTKKIIVVDGNKVETGFILNGKVEFLADNELNSLSAQLEDKEYEDILSGSYKMMIIDIEILSDLKENDIKIGDGKITKTFAISVLKSENPYIMLQEKGIGASDLAMGREDSDDKARVKAALFGSILANDVFTPKSPLVLFSEYKEGNIIIYPETPLFRAVRFVPLNLFRNSISTIFGSTKEKVKSLVDEKVN